jgi:WD40 repeat protein
MKFSPDGRLLAIARSLREDNRVELWDTETGALQRTIRGFDGPVRSISFSPDGRTLLTGSSGVHQDKIAEKRPSRRDFRGFAELKWWDSQTGEFKQRFEIGGEGFFSEVAATYSPDGKFFTTDTVAAAFGGWRYWSNVNWKW